MRTFLLAWALAAAPLEPPPATPPGSRPVDQHQQVSIVRPNVWVLSGALDNTTVVQGSRGLVLVDDQFASRFATLSAAVRTCHPHRSGW